MSNNYIFLTAKEDHHNLHEARLLEQMLLQHGHRCSFVDFHDISPQKEDIFIFQTIAGYFLQAAEFAKSLDKIEESGAKSINDVRLIRWNLDKIYLRELEQKGAKILDSLWIEKDSEIIDPKWGDFVVKPRISAGAYNTYKMQEFDFAKISALLKDHPLMIQPFAKEIEEDGEYSLIFFGGKFSHAILKRAAKGDFRVQHALGGSYQHIEPEKWMQEAAFAILAMLPYQPNYARIDGIKRDRNFLLMEVEVLEPYLYLDDKKELVENYFSSLAN